MVPLETNRLRLRLFEPGDVAALAALYEDPEVMHFIPVGKEPPDCPGQVERFRDRFEQSGYTLWLAERKDDGAFVGRVGLWPLDGTDEVELAYLLERRHWGSGLATEAAAACLQFGFTQCRLSSIAAIADPDNGASLRVMEKLGFRFVREDRFYGIAVRYHLLHREEWEHSHGAHAGD